MSFVWIIFVLAWTAVFFRVLGSSSVAGVGVIARCWLLGLLWGPIVLGIAIQWIPHQAWFNFLEPALLWIPVCSCLLWRLSYRCLSVSDGFLMGFFLGFGYDWIEELFGIVFREVARGNLLRSLSLMPPTILSSGNGLTAHHYAQHGYWLALPSMVLCASLRFTSKGVAACLTALALVVCGLDRMTWLGLPDQYSTVLEHVLYHGLLVPWLALLALPLLSIAEARWVARGIGRRDRIFRIPLEWSAIFTALANHDCGAAMNVDERSRLFRQFNLVRRERIRRPGDESLARIELAIARRLRQLPEPKDAPGLVRWDWKRCWPQAVVLATSAFVIFAAPHLHDAAQQRLWATVVKLPGYYGSEICFPALVLLAFCAWVCLIFPTHLRAARDAVAPADPGVRYFVERWMWAICLAAGCVLLLYRSTAGWAELISFASPILYQWNMDLYTSFTNAQWVTYLAAFMSLAAIAMVSSATALREERPLQSRVEVLRHAVALACFLPWLIIAWKKDLADTLSQALYQRGFYNGWDQRLGSILAISMVLLATWGTQQLVKFVTNRIYRAAPLEISPRTNAL